MTVEVGVCVVGRGEQRVQGWEMSEMLMDEDRIVTVRNVKDEFGIAHETAQIILTEEWIW